MRRMLGLKCKTAFLFQASPGEAEKGFSKGIGRRWAKPNGLNPILVPAQMSMSRMGTDLGCAPARELGFHQPDAGGQHGFGGQSCWCCPVGSACKAKFRGL